MKKLIVLICLFQYLVAYTQNSQSPAMQVNSVQDAVVLNNGGDQVPLQHLKDLNIASIDLGYPHNSVFDSISRKYWKLESFDAGTLHLTEDFNALHDRLKFFNLIIIKLSDETAFDNPLIRFLADMEDLTKVVFVLSGSGENLKYLEGSRSAVIWNERTDAEAASVSAQVLFGGLAAEGRLDRDYSAGYLKGGGQSTVKSRLAYPVPGSVALTNELSPRIDSIVRAGIAAHSAPAAVILVAQKGRVIFHKAYGSHTYGGDVPVRPDDLFDLASVTKVTATTPSVMRLYDQKQIGLDSLISKYIAATRSIPDKRDIRIREALLHEAGYYPYIKFYEHLKPGDMSPDSSASHPVKVADNYFLRKGFFEEVMWPMTLRSQGNSRGKFVYSDISMYMLKELVEQVTRRRLDEYVMNEFYLPLGMQATGFQPRKRFNRSRIVPTTENDNWFRDMLVQGYVNDPGAAMSDGVQGHAGLFSNANDLAIYYQMLLNKGEYGGERFFDAATVELFTSGQSKVTNRGLGFARLTESEEKAGRGYPSRKAFGHSGYTGTYVWVDPEYDLVFICLTNRVYPDDGKTYGRSKVNLRGEVLDLVYEKVMGLEN